MGLKRATAGFSLVEVATSLGVISFALVALIGVIPVGLDNSRQAVSESRASQMVKMISATLENEPFTAARCFHPDPNATTGTLDFTQLGAADTLAAQPDIVLHASYDVRALPRLERSIGGRVPPEAIYRVELRLRQEKVALPKSPPAVIGTNINVRLFPLRGNQRLGETWIYVPRFQRAALPGTTTVATTP